jgi:flagellar FliL protein
MSTDKAAKAAKPAGDKKPKKGKKKLIVIALAAVLLLGGGGAGYYFFMGGDGPEPPPEPGAVVALEPITVNLADGHFLKVSIALQATAEVSEEVDGSKALDLLISQFSNRSVGELSSNEAREEAKKTLKEKVGKAYHGEIMDIYFTEFVMQ